ncbi:MAG TPA: hypothetical protein VLH13_04820, partial [Methanomassiliicoccales archaeon]|nr:hypothetical protein [Methanomassiliicoccales archaeon]
MRSKTTASLVGLAFLFLISGLASRDHMLVALVIPIALLVFLSSLSLDKESIEMMASWSTDDLELLEGEELKAVLSLENKGRRTVYGR